MGVMHRAAMWMRGPLRRRARDLGRDVYLIPRWAAAASSQGFALPSFLIIGARKGGTSSLFDYLVQHPDVRAPLWKETRFFDYGYHKGLAWYRAQFPRREPGAHWITGEATTGYLSDPNAAERIARDLPDVKLVAILRDPVDRAISDWAHERRRGGETRSARDALAPDPASPYVARSIYAPQVRRFLELFDRRQLLVLEHERLFGAPAEGYAQLLRFLGLSPFSEVRFGHINPGRGGTADELDRRALRELFRPHNRELGELLGRDLSAWDRDDDAAARQNR